MQSSFSAFFSGASYLLTAMTHSRGARHKMLLGAVLILALSTISCDGESIDERGKSLGGSGNNAMAKVDPGLPRSSQDAVPASEGGGESGGASTKNPAGDLGVLTRLVLKGLSQVAAFAGTPVVLTGEGFREGMWVDWQTAASPGLTPLSLRTDLEINSAGTLAQFQMPRGLPLGPVVGTIRSSASTSRALLSRSHLDFLNVDGLKATDSTDSIDSADSKITVLYLGESSGDPAGAGQVPIFTGGPHLICKDQWYRKPTGELVQGSKDCGAKSSSQDPPTTGSGGANGGNVCQRDGEQNCVVTAGFRAAAVERLVPEKIRSGHWIGGVAGQEPVCLKDGGRACYLSLDNVYAAARLDQFGPGDIREGVVIAGVTGTLTPTPPPPLCGSGSPGLTEGCLVGPGWVGVPRSVIREGDLRQGVVIGGVTGTVIPTPGSCTTDGQMECVVRNTLTAASVGQLLPGNIRQGVTLGGVAGGVVPTPGSCTSDGQMECVVRNTLTAASVSQLLPGNIRQGVSLGGVAGGLVPTPGSCTSDGQMECVVRNTLTAASVSQLLPGNIRQGVSLGGVAGGLVPTPASCTMDGQQSCVAQGAYIALTAAGLTPGVIKSGVSLAGVSGAYPSAAFPLVGATSVPDLDLPSFDAKIKSAADFEWFDSNGQRYANQGDGDIIPTNLKQGVTVFGSAGLLVGGLPCVADGGIGCVTGPRYVAADTQGFGAWDVRLGRQVAGVAGRLVFYKNMAKIDLYDRLVGTASIDGLDVYDTTDDHANIGQFPTENPGGWPQATGANWVREALTDNGAGGGTAGNGQCDGTEACLYDDRLTGLTWVKGDGVQRGFEAAITFCEGLVKGGMSDFRLPTQKELLQAYVDGIWSLKGAGQLNIMAFNWSSTTVSYAFDSGWLAYLNYGYSVATLKTSIAANLCVRGI